MAKQIYSGLSPDPKEIKRLLKLMKPNERIHLTVIDESGRAQTVTFEAHRLDAAVDWAVAQNQNQANVYFAVNTLHNRVWDIKAKKTDIVRVDRFHVDVDDPSEEAKSRILNYEPSPSLVMFSGGGFQAYWDLADSTDDMELAEEINRSLAANLGGDHCQNVDRIMRVVGTINWPNEKKRKAGRVPTMARIEGQPTGHKYSIERFRSHIAAEFLGRAQGPKLTQRELSAVSIEDLNVKLSDQLQHWIEVGDDADKPLSGKNPRFNSRSEAVWAVLRALLKLGVPPSQVAGILLNKAFGIAARSFERSDPRAHAIREVQKAQLSLTDDWPDRGRNGQPSSTLPNALVGLLRLGLEFENDEFHHRKKIAGRAIQQHLGELTDDGCAMLRKIFYDEFKFDPGKSNILDATQILCVENGFHPIRGYLAGLEWDGQPRLDTLLIDYFSAEDTPLNRAIAKIMMVAAVRRVRSPGCKFDTMVVLQGNQGSGKSTAIEVLAGKENFSDQSLLTADEKTQMEQMEGVWLYEVAELEGMTHGETAKIKAALSRTEDRGRPAYARFKERWPRQCIFIGSTNEEFYLKDRTGNRRFWPVKTGVIDLEALGRDRDQLWAEAAHLEAEGFSIVLPKELWADAAQVQDGATLEDPWLDVLSQTKGTLTGDFERISSEKLFAENLLDIRPAQRKSFHHKQVATTMRSLGWEGPKQFRIDGKNRRGYQRPVTHSTQSDDDVEF
ncbi:MAG: virulence-associated E family protein [Rhizobiaceae bacterium]